jgi:Immunity protein 27
MTAADRENIKTTLAALTTNERDIDAALTHLIKIGTDQSGWDALYHDPRTGLYWEVIYPESYMHGGGPRVLQRISAKAARKCYAELAIVDEEIIQSIDIPGGRVVLLDWNNRQFYRFENLFCYHDEGSLRWTASLPNTGTDVFVSVELDNGNLRANTWSGWALRLDVTTGKTLGSEFTK